MKLSCLLLSVAMYVVNLSNALANTSWDGSIELEHRYFWDNDTAFNRSQHQTSARLEMEFYRSWNDGDDQIIFEPFVRGDLEDDERTHADIRQLIWTKLGKKWEFSAGIGRVFWGVTETQHLVDIINQTDGVENIDGEDKLGQPMIRYQYFSDFGAFDAYLLPYFRTRTFPGFDSRLNAGIVVDNNNELYESNSEETHLDYAIRYNTTLGDWSIGLSWFSGTSREPDLFRFFDPQTLISTPYYPQIDQLGADIQLTTGGWLVKLEAIQRNHDDRFYQDFSAATVGTEYTFVGVFGSVYDIGALVEYSWDERDELATTPFQNDLFIGARLSLNDMFDSQVLFGISSDLDDSSSQSFFIEGSTRIGTSLTANVELRYFDSDQPNDLFFQFKDNGFIQIGLEYYFD